MRWVGLIAHEGKKKNACKVLVRKPERKRPLERPRCSWEDNIKKIYKRNTMACTGFICPSI
jgi:hypothetical protein